MSANPTPPARRRVWGIRIRLLIGFIAIGLAIGLLVARGAKKTMVYYVTVSELLDKGDPKGTANGLRVTGTVVPGSIVRDQMELKFAMTDGTKSLPVVYRGVIPDTFSEKGEVVVEGALGDGGTFQANFLMAKCPSKYEASPEKGHPADIPRSGTSSRTS
jgi:cytochrome c-type biogenesis protein CcmE